MGKAKNLKKRLIVMLLSMAMVFTSIPQSMPVYAAQTDALIPEEAETDDVSGAAVTDGNDSGDEVPEGGDASDKGDGEEASGNEGTDGSASGNEGTDESGSGNEGTGEGASGNGESDASGSENEGTGEGASGNEEADGSGSENEGTDEPAPGDEELDAETPMESLEGEEADVEESLEAIAPLKARVKTNANPSGFASVGGWNESIYAEINGVKNADIFKISYSGAMSGELSADDLDYLVREYGNNVRIDIPGLKAGTYTLTVEVGQKTLTQSNITVYPYDRSGFAHFNYSSGVGAYNDDGTLKKNAVVLYVTDKNKNDVTLTCGNITVKGIGNILNSVGQASSNGKTSNGGTANTNQGIIKALAKAGKPLVVRFIGTVSETGLYAQGTYNASDAGLIEGLTDYNSLGNGGSLKDNGHMARIQSGKDVTLEGIGYDAVIDGWGFHYIAEGAAPELGKSFEVRNLEFINTPEDAIGMEGQQASKNVRSDITSSVERCWIHNNEFYRPHITSPAESDKSEGDGSVDFKRGMYFTCSYNYFDSCHKTNLVGSADYSLQFNLSYHHNYWYMCKARGPLTRNANVHMYNNVIDMQTDYAMNTRADAYIFSEYNLFYACKSPQAVEAGAIKSYNDSIASVIWNLGTPGTVVNNKSAYVSNACQFQYKGIKYDKFDTDSSLSYIPGGNYQLEEKFTDLRKVIASQTGVQEKAPKRPEDVTAADYSVVERNGAAVNTVSSLPFTTSPGKISKTVYAFQVNAPFNAEITYSGADGVLVNEEGANVLEGNGSATNLPAGKYMIQAVNFQPGDPAKKTVAVFKDITVSELKLTAFDSSQHYHNWKLDSAQSKAATCTEEGENVYTCTESGCTENTKKEKVNALGHSYSNTWTIDIPATETTPGEKSHHCIRCDERKDITEIPVNSGGGEGGDDNGIIESGDYILTFEGKTENDAADFYTIGNGNFATSGSTTVNGTKYTDCLKIESKTTISFTCGEGAKLFMAFDSTETGKRIKVGDTTYTTDSKGTITVELSAGTYNITKVDSMKLYYVSVANKESETVYYKLSFEYNYEGAPDAKTLNVAAGKTYASFADLTPSSFNRTDYILKGFYTDASCTKEVAYPYSVNGNATLYADWEEDEEQPVVITHSLIFNSNGGSAVATVRVASNQVYRITPTSTKDGYTFIGWYDALENGNLVTQIDGSKLTGDMTVYAHWSEAESVKHILDCAKDLSVGDITENKTVNGFTMHALPGGVGDKGSENPKYYMTVKESKLYTNGVRITDTGIAGNEDGMLKSIEFTTEGSGLLSVETALSGKPASNGKYALVLVKKTAEGYTEVSRSSITTGTTKTTKEFDIDEAGTYYLYAEGDKGVVYYTLKITEQVYYVLYQPGNGTAPEGLNNATVNLGDSIAIPGACTPAAGYTFKGWSINGSDTLLTEAYTVNPADINGGAVRFTAIYEAITYTIKYDAKEGTLPAGMEASVTAKTGERLTLGDCTPPEGKKFLGWAIGSGNTFKSSYTVNAADAAANNTITIEAVYVDEGSHTEYYTVKLNTDGGIYIGDNAVETSLAEGETLELGKCEKSGYTFKGWSVDGGTTIINNSYTVKAADVSKGAITLKAIYEAVTYTVRLDADGGTLAEGNEAEATLTENEIFVLGKCEKSGYTFKGWSLDGGTTVINDVYTVKAADASENVITLKAIYEAVAYTVKYDANGGSLPEGAAETVTAAKGDKVTLPDCIPASGQKFIGWTILSDEILAPESEYTVNEADVDKYTDNTIIIKAVYVPDDDTTVYYTVIFDTDGGTLVNGGALSKKFKEDDSVILDECEKSGYTFKGWSLDGGETLITDKYTVRAADADTENTITIQAVYEAIVYTVRYVANEGQLAEGVGEIATGSVGESITLPECIPSIGKVFKGWAVFNYRTGASGEILESTYTVSAADADTENTITLVAVYGDAIAYTIKYDAATGSLPPWVSNDSMDYAGASITLPLCIPPKEGNYKFRGWRIGDSTEIYVPTSTYIVNAADADENNVICFKAVYESYENIVFTIKYDAGTGSLAEGEAETVKASIGDIVTLPDCVPASGQKFIGWTIWGDEIFAPKSEYPVSENGADINDIITIKAVYAPDDDTTVYYTLVFDTDGGTFLHGADTISKKVKENDSIALGECEKSGYRFIGWSVDGGKTVMDDIYTYTVKASDASENKITLKAVYEARLYRIEYDAEPGKLAEGAEETVISTLGERITLPECIPPSGLKFIGWIAGDSEELLVSPYVVNAADAMWEKEGYDIIRIVAAYAPADDTTAYYTVLLDTNGGTLVDGGAIKRKVRENESVNPGSCEKAEYTFTGWSVDGELVDMPYIVTKNVTLKAEYNKKPSLVPHEGIAIVGLEEKYEYTGAKIIPNIGVVDYDIGEDGRLLTPGVDYTVKYSNNVKVSAGAQKVPTVTVTGKGNYAGKDTSKTFEIVAADNVVKGVELEDLKGAKLAKIEPVEYTGEPIYPEFTLTLKNQAAKTYSYDDVEDIYIAQDGTAIAANVAVSNNINKGTATILLTGEVNGSKATSVKKTFKITPIDLAKNASSVSVSAESGTYAVKGAAPESITVKYKGITLKNGTDYTVKYASNKTAAQPAQITITGKGNYAKKYTGSDTTYVINPLNMGELEVNALNAYEGLKTGKIKATVVDKDGNALKPAQYTLVVCKDEAGTLKDASELLVTGETIYVKAEAKDTVNLVSDSETPLVKFTVGKNIAKAKFVINKLNNGKATKEYTGGKITLGNEDLTVTYKNVSGNLVMGTHYEIVSYSNNINKGTATAVIQGIGEYSGTKTIKFKIVGKTMRIGGKAAWDDLGSKAGQVKDFIRNMLTR